MSWIITGKEADPLLLDSYSGAAAAYSLRQLSWAYGGPVVRVRRDNDDAEQDFTATEISDGTLAAWVGAGNGGFVRTWYDQSGNGSNAEQATAANQPKIVDSTNGLITENESSAINFDGIGAYLSTNFISQDSTVFCVSQCEGTDDSQDVAFGAFSANARFYLSFNFTSNTYLWGYGTAANSVSPDIAQQVVSVYNAYQKTGHINSTEVVNFSGGKNYPALSIFIGALNSNSTPSALFMGEMQELILYPSDQSANRAAIESNINAHYNIF